MDGMVTLPGAETAPVSEAVPSESPADQTPLDPQAALLAEADLLQKKISEGMPTQFEMMKGEPRTIDRHRRWEKRNNRNINRYIQLREQLKSLPSVEALRLP